MKTLTSKFFGNKKKTYKRRIKQKKFNTLIQTTKRATTALTNINLELSNTTRNLSTTKALLSSDDENSRGDTPSSTDENLTNHDRYSSQHQSNLYNKPGSEIPTKYLGEYIDTLTRQQTSIDNQNPEAEILRKSYQDRIDDLLQEEKTRPSLTRDDFSEISSSNENESEMSETDNISKLTNLALNDIEKKTIEENEAQEEREALAEQAIEAQEAHLEREVIRKAISENEGALLDPSESSEIHEKIREPSQTHKEITQQRETSAVKESDIPVTEDNTEAALTKKRKFEEEQGESSTQPATRFKQDSTDIVADTDFPDIFDMGGE